MMTPDQILDAANRAYHDNRLADWRGWHSLLLVLGYMPTGSALVHVTQSFNEACERLKCRQPNPDQRDRDEFDEEHSIGGQPYRSIRQ